MAIAQTGSATSYPSGARLNSGTVSSAITVPADAEMVLVCVSGYGDGSADYYTAGGMTFTKGGADTAMVNAGGTVNASFWMGSIFYQILPDTGSSKSLKWDWKGTSNPGDETLWHVTFWKGIDTASPIRDIQTTQGGSIPATTPTVTCVSGDLLLAWCALYSTSQAEASIDSWTNVTLLDQATHRISADGALASGSPSGNTTASAVTTTNGSENWLAAFSVKPASSDDTFANNVRLFFI